MAGKALNVNSLRALGTDRLAELLIEVTKGRADLQRRLRLELSAHHGSDDVARDIRKRYASIRQAKGYLSRKTHHTFAKEIRSLMTLAETRVAPDLAFDLLWELLHLAPGVLARTKDGEILKEAFGDAMLAIARLAPNLTLPAEGLADTLFDALSHDKAGTFAGAVAALAPALGVPGLEHLKQRATRALTDPPPPAAADRYRHIQEARRTRMAQAAQHQWLGALLRDIADAQGDVDAYIARFSAAQLTEAGIASDVAARLLAADRADEGLAVARAAMGATPPGELEDICIACLQALGREDELRTFLWDSFNRRPDAGRLRRYLRLLPDFDDIEAEDEARRVAQGHPNLHAALRSFIDRADLPSAASLVLARAAELDGSDNGLRQMADALDGRFPLAATLLRRAFILAALDAGRAARPREAAVQLLACAEADTRITDHSGIPDHETFVTGLRRTHGRRRTFWAVVAKAGATGTAPRR